MGKEDNPGRQLTVWIAYLSGAHKILYDSFNENKTTPEILLDWTK